MNKKINPAAIHALIEALSLVFWYKTQLRTFLTTALPDNPLISQLDWTAYKRVIIGQFIKTLSSNPKYFDDILTLMLSVDEVGDPVHLKSLDDGGKQYREAVDALRQLNSKVSPYRKVRNDEEEAYRRQREHQARAEMTRIMSDKLDELKTLFFGILKEEPQQRGYALEKLIKDLFSLFDIDSKASFKIIGEQIDGAFTFDNTEYLFEAKWQNKKSRSADLDIFSGKIGRKLDNTLGLFLSMSGFEQTAVDLHSQNRSSIVLMDGADLTTVLEGRVDLQELLKRKKQHASRTGQIMMAASSLL